jgi:recombination protein RecT
MNDTQTQAVQLTPEQQKKALAKNRMSTLKANLNAPSVLEQFKNVLAENSGPFIASIIDLYNGSADLQDCDPNAVIFEALKAAALKLPVNKSLGFAYLVAYRSVPTMLIGYKGYIQLAMRTGQYRIINADEVYEGEFVKKNKLTGEFDLNGEAISDKVVGYFAHFEMINGFTKTLYMTVEQVKAWAKKYSPSSGSNFSPWQKEFPKMAMKTLLRNLLSHWGYMSVEMIDANQKDQEFDASGEVQDEIDKKGNSKNLSFDDAIIVDDKKADDNQPPAVNNNPAAGLQPSTEFNNKPADKPGFE